MHTLHRKVKVALTPRADYSKDHNCDVHNCGWPSPRSSPRGASQGQNVTLACGIGRMLPECRGGAEQRQVWAAQVKGRDRVSRGVWNRHECLPNATRYWTSGRGKPVFGPQRLDTSEFVEIAGDHDQPSTASVTGDHHVVGANDPPTALQIGADVGVMRRCLSVERQHIEPSDKALDPLSSLDRTTGKRPSTTCHGTSQKGGTVGRLSVARGSNETRIFGRI